MQPQMANKKTPPKFAIENGFVIGRNNTNDPTNETVEANYEGGTYFFSLAQDLSENTLVYGSSDLLLQCLSALHQPYWCLVVCTPTMLR